MNESSINQADVKDYDFNFLTGIYCLFNCRYQEARLSFLSAIFDGYPYDEYYSVYQSYLGLTNALIDYKDDIVNHCYHSTDVDISMKPEVQLNLACAEFIKGNRKRAFQAMEKISSLELSPTISQDVHSFFNIVGQRKKGIDGLPKRERFINKSLGRLFRKKESYDAGDIEAFIIKTTKKRYKDAMFVHSH